MNELISITTVGWMRNEFLVWSEIRIYLSCCIRIWLDRQLWIFVEKIQRNILLYLIQQLGEYSNDTVMGDFRTKYVDTHII